MQEVPTPAPTQPPPPLLAELSQLEFNQWRQHPVTRLFHQFLADYQEALQVKLLASWRAGKLVLSTEGEARGRILACEEMRETHLDHVRHFYGMPPAARARPLRGFAGSESDSASSGSSGSSGSPSCSSCSPR